MNASWLVDHRYDFGTFRAVSHSEQLKAGENQSRKNNAMCSKGDHYSILQIIQVSGQSSKSLTFNSLSKFWFPTTYTHSRVHTNRTFCTFLFSMGKNGMSWHELWKGVCFFFQPVTNNSARSCNIHSCLACVIHHLLAVWSSPNVPSNRFNRSLSGHCSCKINNEPFFFITTQFWLSVCVTLFQALQKSN